MDVPDIDALRYSRHDEQTHAQMAKLVPIYIRSLHGHSSLDRTIPIPWGMEWVISSYETTHVYHSGKSSNLDSIIRCGLLPGGACKDQRRRSVYFSIRDPRGFNLSDCAGRPVQYRPQNPINRMTLVVWPPSPGDDAVYVVEVRRCYELDIIFKQNSTGSILCHKSIPPECISEVTSRDGKYVLYRNDTLGSGAPGDRKLKMDLDAPIQRATLFTKREENMKSWPEKVLKSDASIEEEEYYKNYDKNFNDEQMCEKCMTFSFKGLSLIHI